MQFGAMAQTLGVADLIRLSDNCSSSRSNELIEDWKKLDKNLGGIVSELRNIKRQETQKVIKFWFGVNDAPTAIELAKVLDLQRNQGRNVKYKCVKSGSPIIVGPYGQLAFPNEYADALVFTHDPTNTLYVYDHYFDPKYFERRPVVLIHEISHMVLPNQGYTRAEHYGRNGSHALSQKNPAEAKLNADNYAFFVADMITLLSTNPV